MAHAVAVPPWVVVRCYNDMPVIEETLHGIRRQTMPSRILLCDNASLDGSRETAEPLVDQIIDIPAGQYVPGRVLNQAMDATDGERVVFLNSDCTPRDETWLENLLAGFSSDDVAAVFGRQDPRPDCRPLFAKDAYETFGDGSRQKNWRHCFSMASSAIRRNVWNEMPFREDITYSEDIDWTWRVRQSGRNITYAANSGVFHSHNYTVRQWYRRQYGEGRAEARIFEWTPTESSLLRYTLLPIGKQVLSDWWYALGKVRPGAIFLSPVLRTAQALGRRRGFLDGRRE